MQKLIILDAGHSGMVNGKYLTAPSKMFKHTDGTIAYEGVINRQVKDMLKSKLTTSKIDFLDVSFGNEDIPLRERVKNANDWYHLLDRYDLLYLSIHSNAGHGSGFEVWTSPGQTLSDKYAQICAEEIKSEFKEFPFRANLGDGDLDKEEKFYVLVHTLCPAILVELLFFDNPKDWKYQQTPEYIERITDCLLRFVKKVQLI
jgi:N-acetylmuramoyl-L-alanine amidase